MTLRLWITLLATFGIAASTHAQAPRSYSAYSKRILSKADSVLYVLRESDSPSLTAATMPGIYMAASRRMRLFAGDFDATVPPTAFQRLHDQLVSPLKSLAEKFEQLSRLADVDCSDEQGRGESCNEAAKQYAAASSALRVMNTVGDDVRDYQEARDRAQRMLAEHHVSLPSMRQ